MSGFFLRGTYLGGINNERWTHFRPASTYFGVPTEQWEFYHHHRRYLSRDCRLFGAAYKNPETFKQSFTWKLLPDFHSVGLNYLCPPRPQSSVRITIVCIHINSQVMCQSHSKDVYEFVFSHHESNTPKEEGRSITGWFPGYGSLDTAECLDLSKDPQRFSREKKNEGQLTAENRKGWWRLYHGQWYGT